MFRNWKQATIILTVVGVLLLLIPSVVQRVRSESNKMMCASNMRQLTLALLTYHADFKKLPFAVTNKSSLPFEERVGWLAIIYPYLESDSFYQNIKWSLSYRDQANRDVLHFANRLFRCPSASLVEEVWTSYVGIAGVGGDAPLLPLKDPRAGALGYERQLSMNEIATGNGTSYTMLLGETQKDNGPWYAGGPPTLRALISNEPLLSEGGLFSNHHLQPFSLRWNSTVDHFQFGMVDGSVRSFAQNTSLEVLTVLAAYHSGRAFETVPWDE